MQSKHRSAIGLTILLASGVAMPAAYAAMLEDSFDHGELSRERWHIGVGKGKSFARLEPRDGGKCVHLFGGHASTSLRTRLAVPNNAYTLEYDFFQPADESAGYQAVVTHPRPEGQSHWWLEYGPGRFFLYTLGGGRWLNRWRATGLAANRWYRIRIRNTARAVQVTVFDDAGKKRLRQSPSVIHDEGGPAPIRFEAVGQERGAWGMKIDNVRLYLTPLDDRADYQHRIAALKAAQAALAAERVRQAWPEAGQVLQDAEQAFAAISQAGLGDWPAYVKASHAFDSALRRLSDQYQKAVLAKGERERAGWTLVDISSHFNAEAALHGIASPGLGPMADVSGVPFLLLSFGRNCLWQDLPSRSQNAIELAGSVKRLALLMAVKYEGRCYARDDSLVDVLQVELRYADGFRELVVPVPVGWQPDLPTGVGRPPFKNGKVDALVVDPGHAAALSHVVLCDDAISAGWALMGLSYQAGRAEELPVIRAQAPAAMAPERTLATVRGSANEVVIESAALRAVLDARHGLLRELRGDACGQLLTADKPSPFFAVQLGEELVYSDEFLVMGTRSQTTSGVATVTQRLRGPGEGGALEVTISLATPRMGAMTWAATLRNVGKEEIKPRLVFPLLDGMDLGPRPGWYFPQRGGAASSMPLEGLSSYGGMAWLQLMDAHRSDGGGLYMRCDDTTGMHKVFALRSSPDEDAKPRRIANIPKPAHAVDPWRARAGVHMSIQYLPRSLAPGQSWSPPSVTVAAHAGDWHAALADYRAWLKTWWRPRRPCPDRYKYGFYALVGGPPRDTHRNEAFGSYDWWHLSGFWTIDYPDDLPRELADLRKQAGSAARWDQAVGVYIEGMVLEKKRRIARERGADWAMMDDEGNYYTYYAREGNPVWNLCPAVPAWQQWDAQAYAEIARRVPLCAMYVDSTGSRWAEVCHNPAHAHDTPGIWVQGCAQLFEGIRQALMKASPQTAVHSEEPGSDYMALHEDGSWSHSLWTALSGDEAYNPAGLNYFRFALPEFKMYEIPAYTHALWRCKLAFFNGEGLWTGQPDELRRELFIRWFPTLREHAETFLSEDVAPAIQSVSPPLYMNRFRRRAKAIYTLYNAGLRTRRAEVRLPMPANGHVLDLLSLREMPFETQGADAVLRLRADPHEVMCLMVAARLLEATVADGRARIALAPGARGKALCAALIDGEGARRHKQEVNVPGGAEGVTVDLRERFAAAHGRALLRVVEPHATLDAAVVDW